MKNRNNLRVMEVFDRLRNAFTRYYNTPFELADKRLQEERTALINRDGGAYRHPHLELRPEYVVTEESLNESLCAQGVAEDLAKFVQCGLIPQGRKLYKHQVEALLSGTQRGRNTVVTAGTGSGKTESFLLPLISSLLDESKNWGANNRQHHEWWNEANNNFVAQRAGEKGRQAAVRGIILYPMNALVDDQLVRLRKALDSANVREWMDRERGGHRFYFGRYTSATPVSGKQGDKRREAELRTFLADVDKRSQRARETAKKTGDSEIPYFLGSTGGAEMLTRWDMYATPPDILITNYSMLNIMIHRERDAEFFSGTRKWLEDPENIFTLVVDELHSYRGTSGTEVAYLIRSLKISLGLENKPEQFRVIAASASLEPERDREYVSKFFDIDETTIDFVAGAQKGIEKVRGFTNEELLQIDACKVEDLPILLENSGFAEKYKAAFLDDSGNVESKSLSELAKRLFPETDANSSWETLGKIFNHGFETNPEYFPKSRSHMFFRNVAGIWACTSPQCEGIPGGTYPGRKVGRLYSEPRNACECGARVLELLYCQNCGDTMLGGFVAYGELAKTTIDTFLLTDSPDLAAAPNRIIANKTAENFLVFSPDGLNGEATHSGHSWKDKQSGVHFEYRRSILDPSTGRIRNRQRGSNGWSFHVKVSGQSPNGIGQALSPFPTQCISCREDWEQKYVKNNYGGWTAVGVSHEKRKRSPIRMMGTGFERVNQVLTTEVLTLMEESARKAIVFTDSRQDAAKLSNGLALRHYENLVRQLAITSIRSANGDSNLLRDFASDPLSKEPRLVEFGNRLKSFGSDIHERVLIERSAILSDADLFERFEKLVFRPIKLTQLAHDVEQGIIAFGMNPAGPKASLERSKDGSVRWPEIYDWTDGTPVPKSVHSLSAGAEGLKGDIQITLFEEIVQSLYSGSSRDFESLGYGWLTKNDDDSPSDDSCDAVLGLARGTLRVLADSRRFIGLRKGQDKPTSKLRAFWGAVADKRGTSIENIEAQALHILENVVVEYLIDPDKVVLRTMENDSWICEVCKRLHLNYGAGVCTKCNESLHKNEVSSAGTENYFVYNVENEIGNFRLNATEITGQTDRADAQSRQSRFQGIFLDEENSRTDTVDLLSVTTTMEAGVDIGALSIVILGNMPPSRFNYQQRVGRAGRRDDPLAIALTVCRGRTHDEYYFERPEEITNAPTPAPYLAMNKQAIFIRFLRASIMNAAFRSIRESWGGKEKNFGNNTHGEFGFVEDWGQYRSSVIQWISENDSLIQNLAMSLASRSGLSDDARKLTRDLCEQLIQEIDAVTNGTGHYELSQRMAETGLLPMFGFPTSVRYLHLERPTRSLPWPPPKTVDRELAMAISEFAPMSEVIRDGEIFPIVGVAAFRPVMANVVTPLEDPLGQRRIIETCDVCSYVGEVEGLISNQEDLQCPRCGAGDQYFRTLDLREPLGFRAGKPRDFDGNFSWSARALPARAKPQPGSLTRHVREFSVNYSGSGSLFVINDNNGRQFSLRKTQEFSGNSRSWGGYVSSEALEQKLVGDNTADEKVEVSFGAAKTTDILLFGSNSRAQLPEGIELHLGHNATDALNNDAASETGRRASWYSLAFLMRAVAAPLLDVRPQEFEAGIYTGRESGNPTVFAFLADRLENGAGLCTELGHPEKFELFVRSMHEYIDVLEEDSHKRECDHSCYKCLRDYQNMTFHPLLSWRYARDLLGLLDGRGLSIDYDHEQLLIDKWASVYKADTVHLNGMHGALFEQGGRFLLIPKHPMESSVEGGSSRRLDMARKAMVEEYGDEMELRIVDSLTLAKSPSSVFM